MNRNAPWMLPCSTEHFHCLGSDLFLPNSEFPWFYVATVPLFCTIGDSKSFIQYFQ